jgi:hypothetical protein
MSEFGNIQWQRFDADDEATHPDTGKELIIIALKGGKPVYIPRGYFGLGIEFFYEVKTVKGCRVTKRNEYKVKDFDDIAWAYLDIPSWWIRKEKEE